MQILRDDQVPPCDERWIYREIAWPDLVFGLVLGGIAAALAAWPFAGGFWTNFWLLFPCLAGAACFGAFARVNLGAFRASLRSEGWLVRCPPEGLALRYRSRYNHRFPASRPSVVLLERAEIAAIGPVTVILDAPDERGDWTSSRKRRCLEIEPAPGVSLGRLTSALTAERSLRSGGKVRVEHHPVSLTRGGAIRVEMRRPQAVCRALAGGLPIRPDRRVERRFDRMTRGEREDHVLDLLLAGDKVAAIKAARELYGCDLAEAKRLVDDLAP